MGAKKKEKKKNGIKEKIKEIKNKFKINKLFLYVYSNSFHRMWGQKNRKEK